MLQKKRVSTSPKQAILPKILSFSIRNWWNRNLWNKIVAIFIATIIFCLGGMYGIAEWYINKHAHEPLKLGATFIPQYARFFDLDAEQTMDAMINELGIKHLRLVSYWEEGEAVQGTYNFTELDWQLQKAQSAGVTVTLAIGLRQPRWPECHMPTWAASMPKSEWEPRLRDYMTAVINHVKNNPTIISYQLENEYFLKVFGICPDFSRQRLVDEYNLVKSLDPSRTLVVSMSNNAIGTPIGEPTPDMWAISVYKRVWDKTITKRYFEYPIPAWYYAFRAGWTELTRGHNSFIHELQAEAWTPEGYNIKTAPVEELYKSLNPDRLHHRIQYGVGTGMKEVDLWGVEWWYAMKVKRGEPSLWQAAQTEIQRVQEQASQ
jgi:hypothetical protein